MGLGGFSLDWDRTCGVEPYLSQPPDCHRTWSVTDSGCQTKAGLCGGCCIYIARSQKHVFPRPSFQFGYSDTK